MKSFPIAMIAASLLLGSSLVHATEPATPHVPLQKTIGQPLHQAPVPTLGVLNSDGAMLEGSKLTLTGIAGNVIVFADRLVCAAGHETVELFISRWAEGKNSFSVDPPNATVSVLGGEKDGVTDEAAQGQSHAVAPPRQGHLAISYAMIADRHLMQAALSTNLVANAGVVQW